MAESIIEVVNEVGGVEVSLKELKEVDLKEIPSYDALLIVLQTMWVDLQGVLRALLTSLAS